MRQKLFALALASFALATPAAAMEASARYVLTLGGINIASADVTLTDDGSRYAIDLAADVIGLGNLVARGRAAIASGGTVSGNTLTPETFELETSTSGDRFIVRVEYAGGTVTSFVADPPLASDYGRVPIERAHLRGVTDMLSAFVIKGGALDSALCDRDEKVFTGLERFDIRMSFSGEDTATSQRTGYQGPVILCNIRYIPVSGHFPESAISMGLAESDRILIWYAPLGETGYFVPYRVVMGTTMGDLSMVLTGLSS